MPTQAATVIGPQDGRSGSLGAIGVRLMVDGTAGPGRSAPSACA